MTKEEFTKWIETTEESYKYQLLDRMRTDCDYFLGYGNRCEQRLWAESIENQIAFMGIIYNLLSKKPEWLNLTDIAQYEAAMKSN